MIEEKKSVLIVEDEELLAMQLEMMADSLGYNVVAVVDNAAEALSAVNTQDIDLILMDIVIKGEYDGIELVGLIHQQKEIPIIFMTSQTDDLSFKRASRFEPEAYLQKPFSELQLKRSMALGIERNLDKSSEIIGKKETDNQNNSSLFVRKKQKIFQVDFNDIFYIESDGKYSRIYTDGDLFMIRLPLNQVLQKLPLDQFIKCHRSFVVNLKKIKSMDLEDDYLILEARKVPFSRRQKNHILERLNYI